MSIQHMYSCMLCMHTLWMRLHTGMRTHWRAMHTCTHGGNAYPRTHAQAHKHTHTRAQTHFIVGIVSSAIACHEELSLVKQGHGSFRLSY